MAVTPHTGTRTYCPPHTLRSNQESLSRFWGLVRIVNDGSDNWAFQVGDIPPPRGESIEEITPLTSRTLWTPQIGGSEPFLLKHCSLMRSPVGLLISLGKGVQPPR